MTARPTPFTTASSNWRNGRAIEVQRSRKLARTRKRGQSQAIPLWKMKSPGDRSAKRASLMRKPWACLSGRRVARTLCLLIGARTEARTCSTPCLTPEDARSERISAKPSLEMMLSPAGPPKEAAFCFPKESSATPPESSGFTRARNLSGCGTSYWRCAVCCCSEAQSAHLEDRGASIRRSRSYSRALSSGLRVRRFRQTMSSFQPGAVTVPGH